MARRNQKDDLKKLADAFYKNLEITPWEFGGIGLDPKRPFGNSDSCRNMLKIIGWKPEGKNEDEPYTEKQVDYVYNLYPKRLIPFLQKNWKIYTGASMSVAETAVKRIENDRRLRIDRAVHVLTDIFESLNKPARELISQLYHLNYDWKAWIKACEEEDG